MLKRRKMSALIFSALLAGVTTGLAATPVGAVTAKTGLLYGDSLGWETAVNAPTCGPGTSCYTESLQTMMAARTAWTYAPRVMPGGAPCDELQTLAADLATLHPSVVLLETVGNSFSACMNDPGTGRPYPVGSPGFYSKYRADIDQFVLAVQGAGARMVLVKPPPMSFANLNQVETNLSQIMLDEATLRPGTSVTSGPRNAVSLSGRYTPTKSCLSIETPAMGCRSDGKIAVREPVAGTLVGVHLCPVGFTRTGCPVYSSGSYRFARALANAMVAPPTPVVPLA